MIIIMSARANVHLLIVLAVQKLVVVQILHLNSGTVRTRRSFGIIIIDHICIAVNPRVSIQVNAELNASGNIRMDMCTSIDSIASISMSIIFSAAITGR